MKVFTDRRPVKCGMTVKENVRRIVTKRKESDSSPREVCS